MKVKHYPTIVLLYTVDFFLADTLDGEMTEGDVDRSAVNARYHFLIVLCMKMRQQVSGGFSPEMLLRCFYDVVLDQGGCFQSCRFTC